MSETLTDLLARVRACRICEDQLEHGVRPVLQIGERARILIAGQAPGRRVHETGVPFDDASGDRLREWMGVSRQTFYDPARIAILPMGFCYPGTGSAGDLPPRPECAAEWRTQLLARLESRRLTLVVGAYAARWHLQRGVGGMRANTGLTELVRSWEAFAPQVVPLPHPSPRNNVWLARNPWFEREVLLHLRRRVRESLRDE